MGRSPIRFGEGFGDPEIGRGIILLGRDLLASCSLTIDFKDRHLGITSTSVTQRTSALTGDVRSGSRAEV
jgi:hypothetical protein